jgi:spermidine/putrescine transport system substrate-binding protein
MNDFNFFLNRRERRKPATGRPAMNRLPILCLSTSALALPGAAAAQETLNALVWCDHMDPALIEPFEAEHDVRVNLREYEGTGAALSLIEQSRPGTGTCW